MNSYSNRINTFQHSGWKITLFKKAWRCFLRWPLVDNNNMNDYAREANWAIVFIAIFTVFFATISQKLLFWVYAFNLLTYLDEKTMNEKICWLNNTCNKMSISWKKNLKHTFYLKLWMDLHILHLFQFKVNMVILCSYWLCTKYNLKNVYIDKSWNILSYSS